MSKFEDGKTYNTDEPTAWLRMACQARVREILPIVEVAPVDVVMVMLVEPPPGLETEDEYRKWDRTCDRCGSVTEPGGSFLTGETSLTHTPTGRLIVLTYGLCEPCAEKEVP